MPADTSLTLGKETRKRLLAMSKARQISAAELVRNLIDAEWSRENPELVIGFWPLPVRGDVDEPICEQCDQPITDTVYACLLSDMSIVAPLCQSCANAE